MARKSREKLSQKRSIKGYKEQAESNQLLKLFSGVTDYRKAKGKRHKIEHILYLSVLAGLMGATDYKQIAIWIEKHVQKEQIKKLLGVEFILTPKKSVVSEILAKVDSEEVEIIFRKWIRKYVDTTGEHLSVDGKVMNGSRYKDQRSIEVVGAVLSEIGVVIAHQKIAKKSNEIPALQAMIGELDDTFIFTFDAMNTQKKTLDAIEKSGSKYIAKVKDNQKTLLDKIDEISREVKPTSTYKATPIQQSNEWIEREVFVYQPTAFYCNGITHVRSIIKTIKKIEQTNHQTGEVTNSTRIQFCIANFREEAEFFHNKILHHWKVETMHQYKDNALREDDHNCHLNPFLMTIIRSMILNILHLNGAKSIQEQLINNRWDLDDSIAQLLKFSF